MGEHRIRTIDDEQRRNAFTRALLEDLYALERLVKEGRIESGVRRIGAEQEMFLISSGMRPSPIALEVIEGVQDPRLTTELARFNLEANLTPRLFEGDCLSQLHTEIDEVLRLSRREARRHGSDVLLAGILPTLRKDDLGLGNMTPNPRYRAINDAMVRERGGEFDILIRGLDELRTTHDNVMLESCNTSFQLHMQVAPDEFAIMYNIAQAITAPVLAAAVNSPTLLRRRLWSETRVALFETSVDSRNLNHRETGHKARVFFGDDWVNESVLELYREAISHFRVVVVGDKDPESSYGAMEAKRLPRLASLCLHSGTTYRWNRVCYGLKDDVAHLRIENRALPSGPTVVDEVANAAFFFGLMVGLATNVGRIDRVMRFDDAKANFFAAARHGLDAQLRWQRGKCHPASSLILNELLPLAREGLYGVGVQQQDIDLYLGVLQQRVESERTGARWVYDSLADMHNRGEHAPEVRYHALTDAMLRSQCSGAPVHEWELATVTEGAESWRQSFATVGQIMSTQLFSVRCEDILDLAANLMDWHEVRHVPVEDEAGRLIGLVSHHAVLRMFARGTVERHTDVLVKDVMKSHPITASVETPTIQAMRMMKEHGVSCLPVVGTNQRLVGLVTERDLMLVAGRLLERLLHPESAPVSADGFDASEHASMANPETDMEPNNAKPATTNGALPESTAHESSSLP
ncbi:MAG: CBS domain-containing protein [Myxococcota bacterium]